MKNLFLRRVSAFVLAIVLMTTPFLNLYAAPTKQSAEELVQNTETAITRGEFAMLINSTFSLQGAAEENFLDVPEDHPYAEDLLCAKEIGYMSGDGNGNVNPDKTLSGAEAAVIVNNLLGFDVTKVDVVTGLNIPEWARPSASVLLDLTMAGKEIMAKEQLTVSEAGAFLNALSVAMMFQGSPYALTQENIKDDYFAYTNRKYLATATISPGYLFAMAFSDPNLVVQKQENEILSEILQAKDLTSGSIEWQTNELYKMYMDNDARTKSLEKIQPYFDEIKAVKTIDELNAVAKKYSKYFNLQPFYYLDVNPDAKVDATKWAAFVSSAGYDLGSKDYYAEDESLLPIQQAYKDYLRKQLQYMGETENIEARVNAIYEIEKTRASKDLAREVLLLDPNVIYTKTTWEEILDITKTTQSLTYSDFFEIAKEMNVYCANIDYVKYIETLYTEANLPVLKDFAMLNVFSSFSSMLGDDTQYLADDLISVLYGQIGEKQPLEQRAQSFVTSLMQRTFSRKYAERFCSEKVKNDVTEIVESIRDKYRDRIMSLTWMSDETKKEAVAKLDAIKPYIAYPDEPLKDRMFDIKAKDEGGNLIDFYFNLTDIRHQETLELMSKPATINYWEHLSTSTVNAFYVPTSNSIVIPAGILQEPFYNPNESREKNLGAIGAIIAHEISHAFDNTGAQYDKNGTFTNWWTDEDYAAFGNLTQDVESALSAITFVGDANINGALCTGETIADLGAISCILDIANDMPDGDLSKVMESWSAIWAARMSPEVAAYLLSMDTHAPNKTRVNFILSQMEDFYRVYSITEDDGMFVPKEDRISIW